MKNELMLTDNGYQQLMKHACRLAQDGHGELAQHLREYAPGEKGAYWWRKHLDEAIAALIAAPAAPQQAEPVGYFVNDESDDQWHQVDYEQRNGADTYPLYLHPPADEVRRLRDALDEIESETQDVSIQQIARKALEGK